MPLYEYQCQSCGHQVELLMKNADSTPDVCPKCNSNSLQRQVSAPRFQLKGTGWYETDFKNKPQSSSQSTTSAEKSDKSADKTKKSE